ncbi:oocyte zinc finger protein XlCOF6 isoform X2 [Alligator mississippiensis]|uniref:oocyte zinc finger protein XlCOF6 isoform X2 n=1 Tax=Alligator mississippiensis TaxID=8496 RepID=UPI0028773B8A|nr:oocyte zinc finger protein XlCOF6 isoform X2 [Alligator mississippiensis]
MLINVPVRRQPAGALPLPPDAGTLRTAEEQPPKDRPVTLELLRPFPGRSGERGPLTPELGQVHKKQGRHPQQGENMAVSKLPEAFEDVAVYFTRKEWELLEAGDKGLYQDQMLRNYQALVSLGLQGPAPDLICRMQLGEMELWVCDDEEAGESSLSEDFSPAGAGTLSSAEEQPPEDEPGNLELLRLFPGRFGEKEPLTPEPGQIHEKQGKCSQQRENVAVSKILEAFEDVAVFFTREEWELLEAGDKGLYQNQMLRNYQALVSLGLQGPAPDLICRMQLGEMELWVCDDEEAGESLLSEDFSPDAETLGTHLCLECGESFVSPSKLRVHQDVHSGEQLYRCTECKSFTRWDHLQNHTCVHVDEKPFYCLHCGKSFTKSSKLMQHQHMHTEEKQVSCSQYRKSFTQSSKLTKHLCVHTGEKPFSCSQCGKSFTQSSKLTKHLRVHTGEKPFSCSQCGKSFTQSSKLTKHLRVHTGEKPFSCSQCGKNFTQSYTLTRHLRVHSGEKLYSCCDCGKSFTRRDHLHGHMRVHTGEKPFSCTQCEKSFSDSSTLAYHLRVHMGEKPFCCSECGKSFTSRSKLTNHLLVHTGEKPFSCSQCGKSFNRKSRLTDHLNVHTGKKPFFCSQCGKSYTHSFSLSIHLRLHTGEKRFSCSQCGKNFMQSSNLTSHIRVHTGEKPFSCSQCGKSFSQNSSLKHHLCVHTGEKPFSCSQCGKTFTKRSSLMNHLCVHKG